MEVKTIVQHVDGVTTEGIAFGGNVDWENQAFFPDDLIEDDEFKLVLLTFLLLRAVFSHRFPVLLL